MKQAILFFAIAILTAANTRASNDISMSLIRIQQTEHIIARVETERHTWIATPTAVWRVNKKNDKAVKFTPANSVLPAAAIRGLCAAKDGNVYIATSKGIVRYDNFALLLITTENSDLPSNNILSIEAGDHNALWIHTAGNGLVKMQHGRCKVYDETTALTAKK